MTDHISGRDGTDTVIDVEGFQFRDVTEYIPEVIAFNPPHGAENASITGNIIISFSENVVAGSGFIELLDANGIAERYNAETSVNLTFDGDTLTIDPMNNLAYNTGYSLRFSSGSVLDLNGFAYNPASDSYEFTTEGSGSEHYSISGSVSFWKSGAPLEGVELNLIEQPDGAPSSSGATGSDGLFGFGEVGSGLYELDADKALGSEDGDAVQPADALAALKIAFGMNPNETGGAEVSPYQYLATDVDRDGVVEPADALNILKMAFGMQTETEQEWVIVPESVGGEEMSNGSVDWSAAEIPDVTLDQDLDVQLVGVLMGDVDGSWMATGAVPA